MDDLISRQAAIEALKRAEALTRAFGYHHVIETIRELPTAEPMTGLYVDGFNDGYKAGKEDAEPRKGKWEVINEKEEVYSCSECGFVAWSKAEISNYCPNCGARMEE